jgi:hypothetical protein
VPALFVAESCAKNKVNACILCGGGNRISAIALRPLVKLRGKV